MFVKVAACMPGRIAAVSLAMFLFRPFRVRCLLLNTYHPQDSTQEELRLSEVWISERSKPVHVDSILKERLDFFNGLVIVFTRGLTMFTIPDCRLLSTSFTDSRKILKWTSVLIAVQKIRIELIIL
jgi:hypothetical protein